MEQKYIDAAGKILQDFTFDENFFYTYSDNGKVKKKIEESIFDEIKAKATEQEQNKIKEKDVSLDLRTAIDDVLKDLEKSSVISQKSKDAINKYFTKKG